jgi:nitrite reductase (NADH) small subunit
MNTTAPRVGHIVLNLGSASRVPVGEGRTVRFGPLAIAVFRTREGQVYVTDAACSHKQGPLADGTIGSRVVVCPLHACSFDLQTGEAVGHGCGGVKTYPAVINEHGDILVEVHN